MIDFGLVEFEQLLKAVINFGVCTALWFACYCRLNLMSGDTTLRSFRFKYVFLLVFVALSGLGPFIPGEWPTWSRIALTLAFWFTLHGASRAWKRGVPIYARSDSTLSDFASLDEA